MKITLTLTAAALALSACATIQMPAMNAPAATAPAVDPAREAARVVVSPIVADTVPGPAGVVLANCIIDNATPAELATIAAAGDTPENVTLVGDILARDATVSCATTGLT